MAAGEVVVVAATAEEEAAGTNAVPAGIVGNSDCFYRKYRCNENVLFVTEYYAGAFLYP